MNRRQAQDRSCPHTELRAPCGRYMLVHGLWHVLGAAAGYLLAVAHSSLPTIAAAAL